MVVFSLGFISTFPLTLFLRPIRTCYFYLFAQSECLSIEFGKTGIDPHQSSIGFKAFVFYVN